MIISTGYGYLVAVVAFLLSLVSELISESIFDDDQFYQEDLIPLGISFLLSAVVVRFLNRYFEAKRKKNEGSFFISKETISKTDHSLFYIQFKYWPLLLLIGGLVVIIIELLRN